jgi:hypothetical protein
MVAAQSNHNFADTQIVCRMVRGIEMHFIGEFPDMQFSYSQILCRKTQIVLGGGRRVLAESRLQRERRWQG